jgi:DNA-binding LytR/AlgR family response regulator
MSTSHTSSLSKTRTAQHIALADDDKEDCLLFKNALEELSISAQLTTLHDGEQLMQPLNKNEQMPGTLFLDIKMPRKKGSECLTEIKFGKRLKQLTIIIFYTAFEQEVVSLLYKNLPYHYICKPSDLSHFKKIIQQTFITFITQENNSQPNKENFVLTV